MCVLLSLPSASGCSDAFGLTFRLGLLKASVLRIPVESFVHTRIFNALRRQVRDAIKRFLQASICRCLTAPAHTFASVLCEAVAGETRIMRGVAMCRYAEAKEPGIAARFSWQGCVLIAGWRMLQRLKSACSFKACVENV